MATSTPTARKTVGVSTSGGGVQGNGPVPNSLRGIRGQTTVIPLTPYKRRLPAGVFLRVVVSGMGQPPCRSLGCLSVHLAPVANLHDNHAQSAILDVGYHSAIPNAVFPKRPKPGTLEGFRGH